MRILFQGDSITDGCRDRSDYHNMGWGYPRFAEIYIRERHPELELEFINLGIGGNKSEDLVARWQTDCIDLQPDIVSVMIGVNDTWHNADNKTWIPDEIYERNFRAILERVKKETKAKIIILEQFLLPSDDKDFFREDIDPKIQITRKLAREYADVFVPVDGAFAAACVDHESTYWSEDAVHPYDSGSQLIAKLYADAFDKLLQL